MYLQCHLTNGFYSSLSESLLHALGKNIFFFKLKSDDAFLAQNPPVDSHHTQNKIQRFSKACGSQCAPKLVQMYQVHLSWILHPLLHLSPCCTLNIPVCFRLSPFALAALSSWAVLPPEAGMTGSLVSFGFLLTCHLLGEDFHWEFFIHFAYKSCASSSKVWDIFSLTGVFIFTSIMACFEIQKFFILVRSYYPFCHPRVLCSGCHFTTFIDTLRFGFMFWNSRPGCGTCCFSYCQWVRAGLVLDTLKYVYRFRYVRANYQHVGLTCAAQTHKCQGRWDIIIVAKLLGTTKCWAVPKFHRIILTATSFRGYFYCPCSKDEVTGMSEKLNDLVDVMWLKRERVQKWSQLLGDKFQAFKHQIVMVLLRVQEFRSWPEHLSQISYFFPVVFPLGKWR